LRPELHYAHGFVMTHVVYKDHSIFYFSSPGEPSGFLPVAVIVCPNSTQGVPVIHTPDFQKSYDNVVEAEVAAFNLAVHWVDECR
jgi:hypothetical protein